MAIKKVMPKLYRQLVIFHIFSFSEVIEIKEITDLIKVDQRTINRDLNDLQNAGLLNVKFSRKENGYIHIDDNDRCPFSTPIFTGSKINHLHLEKLIRLATIMEELLDHQDACSDWYKKNFPNKSVRTMQRDFKELSKIKYIIKYLKDEKCYYVVFPEGLEYVEYMIEEFDM